MLTAKKDNSNGGTVVTFGDSKVTLIDQGTAVLVKEKVQASINQLGAEFDFDSLKTSVPSVPVLDSETIKAQAKVSSQKVFSSAGDYYENLKKIWQLEQIDPSDLQITGQLKILLDLTKEKERIEKILVAGPQGVRDQFTVDLLILMIEDVQPMSDNNVLQFFRLIESGGPIFDTKIFILGQRGRKPTSDEVGEMKKSKKHPDLFLFDRTGFRHSLMHIPSKLAGREGKISGADRKLFGAMKNLIRRYCVVLDEEKAEQEKAILAKIEDIKQRSLNDAFHPREIAVKEPSCGKYHLVLPGIVRDGKKVGMDGAAVVEVLDKNLGKEEQDSFFVIRCLEGVGSMDIFRQQAGETLSQWWLCYYREKKKLPENVPTEMRDWVWRACKWLDRAIAYANAQSRNQD
ncbi:hypothetical protein KKD04_02850 [Patescibacteria group bacterium]|nr:hypothetical protein [Patescibacteria group bacterium]